MKNSNLIPYTKILSGDIETPITLFKKYVGEEVGFLLESYDSESKRFSFIGKRPSAIIKSKNYETEIMEEDNIMVLKGKALDQVRDYLSKYNIKNNTNYSFIGGAVGAIAYDIIRQYERIPEENIDKLVLPDLHLMVAKELVIYDHFHNQIVLMVLEEEEEKGREEAERKLNLMEEEIKNSNLSFNDLTINEEVKKNKVKGNTTKKSFMEMVEKAKKYIYEGDIFQVVLSQRWEVETKEHPFTLYRRLRELNPSQYLFYFNFGDYKVVGSSPEMLVKVQNDQVFTCPIAGTRKRGKNLKEDERLAEELLSDEKEKAEHVMLVDLARNDVGRISKIGSVKVTEFMKVKNYSHVMHIVSMVEGEKEKSKSSFDILSSILPAGTLSGAPKIRAMEIIEELEKEKRGIYGGAVGYFGFDGNMDMCIAIRMMVIKDNKAFVQAGAGIVADSISEKEYEECENKAKAIIKILGGDME
ncbi:anthranilate synthase component 1 [Clostridium homopropionicum DSM 5847]|uniref:Anthranilate synthase component 1 n=1 Tax=Clostridium homopropionicum DSM 5847 TaxID=1121318 RepID=A0A0L6ZAH7_9CLOT|nr:anthranilate synthase component I [Clostridium homopropionicum]KOA19979.1 anthranilate synthase component 1 [Clostridium homopropionicum DSM 5847]SFG63828.1 anthranilate synthase, component I [Clostridium homopropionicum]